MPKDHPMPGAMPLNAQHLKSIQVKNQANLKLTSDKGGIAYEAAIIQIGGKQELVLLIGAGHSREAMVAVKGAGPIHGSIDVGKGGLLASGELTVKGMTSNYQAHTKRLLGAFSKKKVTFK
jgi:hypothetical protein